MVLIVVEIIESKSIETSKRRKGSNNNSELGLIVQL